MAQKALWDRCHSWHSDGKKKDSQALIDLLQSYVPSEETTVDLDAEAKAFDDLVHKIAQELALTKLSTVCEPASSSDTFNCELRGESPIDPTITAGLKVRIWPSVRVGRRDKI